MQVQHARPSVLEAKLLRVAFLPPIITVVGKAFFDIGHSLKPKGQQLRYSEHSSGLVRLKLETIPLPKCRMIRQNSSMIPLLSGSSQATTGFDE